MPDLSKLTIPELEALQAGGLSALNVDALTRLQGTPDPAASVAPTTSMGRVGDFLGRNMEIPGSVAGGLVGAGIGSAVPVVGTIIGGILGGAVGAFGGSIGSNAYQDEALDFEEALTEGAISVGFDVATLGMGKVLRPIAKTLGLNTADLLVNVTGRNAVKPAPVLADLPTNVAAGSQESLRLTQQMLEEGGGSLSAAQTGQASFIRRTADEIGQIGLFSGGIAAKRVQANNEVLYRETQRLINGIDPSLAKISEEVGEEVYGIVQAGRNAAEQLYGESIAQINKEFGGRQINLGRFRTMTKRFEKQYDNPIYKGTVLHSSVSKVIRGLNEGVLSTPQARLSDILDLDRVISGEIKEAMPGVGVGSEKAFRQLSELRTQLREAVENTLIKDKRAPAAGKAYKAVKKSYSTTMEELLPELNSSVIRAGGRDNFESIGKLLVEQSGVGKIKRMMRSVDRAYKDIADANLLNKGKEGFEAVSPKIATAAEAKQMMRQSFLQNTFKKVQGAGIDFHAFRTLAHSLSEKKALKRAEAIMGEDFGSYKRLVNAIADSTVDDKRGLFNLAIRSQEINAVGRLAGTAGAVGGSAALAGLPLVATAAAVLTVPSVLAKIATNKRAVNRLIALSGEVARNINITPELVASGMAKVMAELSSEERTSIQRDLRIR